MECACAGPECGGAASCSWYMAKMGLDPVGMEARDGGPVDFPRAVQVVAARERPPDEGTNATIKYAHHLKCVALAIHGR